MTKKLKLVMATNNAGKLREARAIAGDKLEILSLKDIGYNHDIEETANTLEGNALIKVRCIKNATGLDCFADDTGLMVDALDGAPGVYTARYAGEGCTPDDNIDLMLKNMEGVEDRHAKFCTCVALSLNGEEHIFEGKVEGSIATKRSGTHGFGYDPIFIPEETGICFADMTDEDKNAISHRGRAISSMMKWLSALCISIFTIFQSHAYQSSDWMMYNTFDDKIENVFDTPSKTYFIVHSQLFDTNSADNNEKITQLFCLEKESDEIRAYNTQNFLSRPLISMASYNARKNYLLLVHSDQTISILYDNGNVHSLNALANFNTSFQKEITSISFDPISDLAYISTNFGFIAVNDKKHEIAFSGITNSPIDKITRVADKLLIIKGGKLYWTDADANHFSTDDFKELNWNDGSAAINIAAISPSTCLVSKNVNGSETYFMLSFTEGTDTPQVTRKGSFPKATIAENKDGLVLTTPSQIIQINRDSGDLTLYQKMEDDYDAACGSWDLKDIFFAKPRKGFYSKRRADDNTMIMTREPARPNAPAAFRSNSLMYTPRHGMLVNTHGQDHNFSAHDALNPILLSGLKNGTWTMYGLPYLNQKQALRLINPSGMLQDPDNPDLFYFGSVTNGLLRYNIKDGSSILHMTSSIDTPDEEGHVSVQEPHGSWRNVFMILNPRWDAKGNMVAMHLNTETRANYKPEIWIWTPEQRRASTTPETFQQFSKLPIELIVSCKDMLGLPCTASSYKDYIVFFAFNNREAPIVAYDHNGTIQNTSDDRTTTFNSYYDSDGAIDCKYFYCAIEDPATGLIWVASDEGVFTLDPKDIFSEPGKVSRIKVSRNDGTSLADYLLYGTTVNNISIDGLGRKWFALSGGGLVCTTSDGKTILQEITTENSGLPSDMVYSTCYNPDNNSLMIATSAGLCEYYLNGQSNESATSEVRAFPNPVRHDYYGWVTIDGLEEDCIVKITDSAGNLVRELGPASAGKVQWDVCGMDFNRVPSGVYFVLTSSGPGGGSFHEATKILVINR